MPPSKKTYLCASFAFLIAFGITACHAADAPNTSQMPKSSSPATPALSDTQVKALYQNCPNGHYSGPRPGKVRYAKDPYIWVVTPQFASKFCMPPEFVSTELKGVQAIAFKVTGASDDDNCGIGGTAGACFSMKQLRFELFIDSAAKLPKAHDHRYYRSAMLDSARLITRSQSEMQASAKVAKEQPSPALKPHFIGPQVALVGVNDDKIVWPLGMLSEETHFGSVFEGIDYYAFESNSGNFSNPGLAHNGVSGFAIVFDKLNYDKNKKFMGQSLADMAYVIALPQAFGQRVAQEDRSKGMNFEGLLNKAFRPNPGKPGANPSITTPISPTAP